MTVMAPIEHDGIDYARECTRLAAACEDVAIRELLMEMAHDWMVAMDKLGALKSAEAPEQLRL
jgi:hypothetical protein